MRWILALLAVCVLAMPSTSMAVGPVAKSGLGQQSLVETVAFKGSCRLHGARYSSGSVKEITCKSAIDFGIFGKACFEPRCIKCRSGVWLPPSPCINY